MKVNKVLIGLGGNLEDPRVQVLKAIKTIGHHPDMVLKGQSSLYNSSPQGPADQDDFVNAVILIETTLSATQLLRETQAIEHQFGRVKTRHWGERIIDLDILFFNKEIISIEAPQLTIPHPHALKRDFVLIPAIELAPDWQLPDNSYLKEHQHTYLNHNLKRISA